MNSESEPIILMQQGLGGMKTARGNVNAAERKQANNARPLSSIEDGKGVTGKNSGFAAMSRTSTRITGQAAKNKVTGAKSAATRSQSTMDKEMTSDGTFAGRANAQKSVDRTQSNLAAATAKPVSAASSRYVTAPKAVKAKATATKKRGRSIGAKYDKKKAKA